MKAVVAVALMLVSACALSPVQHATIAVSASQALAAFAPVVDKEMHDDFAAHGGDSMPGDERAQRAAEWDRKLEVLHGARDLVLQYGALAKQADDSGGTSVLAPIARRVVAAWVDVLTVADELGLTFPKPPDKLLKFVEGAAQ